MFTANKEQIDAWKAKHGEVFRIQVEGKACYLKKPGRKTLGYASLAGKENPLKFNEILLNDCWLDGDEVIKTDDTLFLSVSSKLSELIEVKEAELEKL
ncbi:MAG: hypothetical protein LBM08_03900 [Dysgonamonadaceae bacterium]|jgi:hypothetical protein|nr:hypothetical protein [Dysgonamonadaceae bacterium]